MKTARKHSDDVPAKDSVEESKHEMAKEMDRQDASILSKFFMFPKYHTYGKSYSGARSTHRSRDGSKSPMRCKYARRHKADPLRKKSRRINRGKRK